MSLKRGFFFFTCEFWGGWFPFEDFHSEQNWGMKNVPRKRKVRHLPFAVLSGIGGCIGAFHSRPLYSLLDPVKKSHSQAYVVTLLGMCDMTYLIVVVLLR